MSRRGWWTELDPHLGSALELRTEVGWTGHFTRRQAPGARYHNGTRIRKVKIEPNDVTPLGLEGTVLGSLYCPEAGFSYFIEWVDKPRIAVFVIEWKLGAVAKRGP